MSLRNSGENHVCVVRTTKGWLIGTDLKSVRGKRSTNMQSGHVCLHNWAREEYSKVK